jgi:hypothetical protein
MRHRLGETFFILTILLAVYLVACLATYAPTDPGPFNSFAAQEVHNVAACSAHGWPTSSCSSRVILPTSYRWY